MAMKRAVLAVFLVIGVPSLAGASPAVQPSASRGDRSGDGPDDAPMVERPRPRGDRMRGNRMPRGERMRGEPMRRDPRAQDPRRARLRQALMQQFDADGDGRLDPREQRRALEALRRMEGNLAGRQRAAKARRFIERHDTNGDGDAGPGEVPRDTANRLRRFDLDGDGWVDPYELRQPPRR